MAKKLTSTKARKILHDKEVHGHPLTEQQRKFFGAIAGGAEPYKAQIGTKLTSLPANYMETLSEALGFPQKAVTKMVTGKYQTPSEAMGITNPIGAFATDAVLDPMNLFLGAGSAKASGALYNVYKINPWAFRPDPEAYYRMVGDKGINDAIESGIIRPPQSHRAWDVNLQKYVDLSVPKFKEAYYSKKVPLDRVVFPQIAKEQGYKGRYSKNVTQYKGPQMVEVKGNDKLFTKLYDDLDVYFTPENISTNMPGVKFYTEDWLRGYKQVKPPKKKQDGGWLDKYDAPQAQNGIEGTMGGLTDVGFNYNGAWGGTMQMGGVLPGAVGFTYARTAGAAPANGPYAKKTKASAQNGQEMKYYQEGLDFKPKTISQDGSDLRLIPRATGDLRGPKIDVKKEQLAAAAKKNQAAREAIERQGEIKPFVPQSDASKTWELVTNPVEALGYVVRGERLPENFSKGQSRTSGLNAIVNTLNPYQIINSGAEFLVGTNNIIKDVVTGDFESASSRVPSTILQGLGAAPILTAFPKGSITRGLQTLSDLPKARTVKEVIGRTGGVPSETSIPRMAMDEVKALRQVQEIGRLKATGARSEEQMRYALQNNLPEEHFQKVFSRSRKEAEDLLASGFGEQKGKVAQTAEEALDRETMRAVEDFNNRPVTPELQAQRDRLRAQMRQLNQRRSVSTGDVTNIDRSESTLDALERYRTILANSPDFRTTIGNSGNILLPGQEVATSFVDRLADDINRSINKTITPVRNINRKVTDLFNKYSQDYPYYSGDVLEKVPSLALSSQGNLKNVSKTVEFVPEGVKSGDVFTGSLNTSHSSYLPQLKQVFKYTKGEPQFLGYRPMNDMGFLSNYGYTNEDIAKYLNSEIDEQIKRGIVPKNIQRPFLKKSLGPDRVILPQYGIRQYQEGGDIPVDPMGYWNPENMGGPVIIPSNVITMEGVDQPLLGISDTGDIQYMEPGEDYEFDGEYVTEYPVMQQGGRTPLYVSDPNDPRLKTYQDSLYNYNVGRRMAGILDADKNLMKVKPGSPYDRYVQTGVKKAGNNLSDNSQIDSGGYKNYERIASIMKEYQGKGNKGILPIRYQGYFPNPDNTAIDLVTLRSVWDKLGVTDPRPPGAAHLPQWKKPEQQVILDPSKAPKKTTTQSKPKPKPPVKKELPKIETKQQEVVKKPEPVVEKKAPLTDYFQGTSVYAPTPYHGSGAGAFVGYRTPQGDTVFVKPEDYERMAVPKYGREFIESKKKMKNGGVSVNNADAQPLKKLDQLLNFTNYNKPTKGGWLDKYN